ncbi:ydaA domain protein, partial [Escherichia coli 2-474-04_S3_C2]
MFCLPGAPSAPRCLAASGRQARLRQAAAGA